MLRKLAVTPVVLTVVIATTGWLYLVRPSGLPGPRIAEALPLDELARHAAVPLAWFGAVWAVAATLLGLAARWARIERLTAALVFGLVTAGILMLSSGASIAITRQIPAREGLHAGVTLLAVYVPAAFVGVAVAVLASERRVGRRAPTLIALLVAAAGASQLIHTVLPGESHGLLLRDLTPAGVGPLARAASASVALALLLAGRGLIRRRRRAWQLAVTLSAVATGLHILHGVTPGTVISSVVLILLIARRHDFTLPGDEETRFLLLTRAAVGMTAIAAYGLAALWLNRLDADQPYTLRFATREIVRGVFGVDTRGSPHLAGSFGEWFPPSLLMLGLGVTGWVLAGWLAPWRHRVRQESRERHLAHTLVRSWGADTLAPFVLRHDKSYFFDDGCVSFLAYRVVGGVAIVSGDPIGPPDALEGLVAAFVEHARSRDWRIAILGASERWLDLYREHGLHALYHGDEAVVDTASFSLEGRGIRKVRQSVHRLDKAGYVARVLRPSQIAASLRHELAEIADAWRDGQPERGFVMALDTLFSLGDDDAVFVVGFDPAGRAQGFLHFAIVQPIAALSLSSMPRARSSTPNGFNEWLICETVDWARDEGFARVSLNFTPFAALLAPENDLKPVQEVQRRALMTLKGHFQLDNLLTFNRKFFPRWVPRFIVYEHRRDLPRVGLAALAAEAYLPFQTARK